jgi:TonB family protein
MNRAKKARVLASGLMLVALGLGAANLPAQEGRRVIANPTPAYPDVARKLHLSGVVKIQVTIGPDGKIKEKNVIGGHPILVSAVEDTLKSWKYAPASGETTTQLEFNFKAE